MKYYIGIDLGGTNVKAGVVSENGSIIFKDRIKTQTDHGQLSIIRDIGLLARNVIDKSGVPNADIMAIGIGSPGIPDNRTGELIFAGNLPFRHAPLRSKIREVVNLPVFVGNDADFAALAEATKGSSRGTRHSVTVTLGTGIGGGIIINKRIYNGFNHAGGEVGHMVIKVGGEPCTCGRRGCFETYASATALVRETNKAAAKNPDSMLNKMIADNNGQTNARIPFEAMRSGDATAARVIDKYIEMLAEGIGNVCNVFMPQVLVIGGGISNEGDALLQPLLKHMRGKVFSGADVDVAAPEIRLAELGNDAGIVGAAIFAIQCLADGFKG